MDPDATLQLVLDAIYEHDAEALAEHAGALGEWLFKGGFLPEVLCDDRSKDTLMVLFDALGELAGLVQKGDGWETDEVAAELRSPKDSPPVVAWEGPPVTIIWEDLLLDLQPSLERHRVDLAWHTEIPPGPELRSRMQRVEEEVGPEKFGAMLGIIYCWKLDTIEQKRSLMIRLNVPTEGLCWGAS